MSTFFEKLTRSKQPGDDAADTGAAASHPEARRAQGPRASRESAQEEQRPMRLRVETEQRPAHTREPEAETPAEEEGELTVDIYDKGDAIVIQSTVAGVKPEDLEVSITNDSVSIRGRRERHEEVREDRYYYKELFWGVFSRSVILPEEIEEDEAEAAIKHGLLTIRLPKKRRGVVQKLKVKVT